MIVCPHCGWENPSEAAFCTNCGRGLARARAARPANLDDSVGEARSDGGRRFKALDAAGRTVRDHEMPLLQAVTPPPPSADRHADAPPMAASTPPPLPAPFPADREPTPLPRLRAPSPARDATATLVDFRMPTNLFAEAATANAGSPERSDAAAEAFDGEEFPGLEVEPGDPSPADTARPGETPTIPRAATPAPVAVAEILPLASLSPSSPLRVARIIEPADAEALVEPGAEGEGDADSVDDIEIPSQPGGDEPGDLQDAVDDPALFEAESPPPALLRPATPVDLADLADVDLDAEPAGAELAEPGGEPEADLEVEDISVSELELPALDAQVLRSGDLEAIRPEPARHAPPPLREMDVRFILRPLSNNVAESRLITVGERGLTIGRVDADVVLAEDAFISPRHLQLTVEHDTLFAEDQGSLNGSWLRVRTQVELRPGMCFRIGHQLLRLDHLSGRPALPERPDRTRRFGAPRVEPALCLQQMGDDNQPRNVYCLSEQGARLGRHLADIVFTDDTFMSGTHAVVLPRGERAVLRDLSSRNGTWVRIEGRQALALGDAIMVGQTVWRVSRPVT